MHDKTYKANSFIAVSLFLNFFKKNIVKKGQTCYNLFKVKEGQKDKT